jgi:outer membrane protein OmpA-like peptidoglycan-associated protein
MFDSIFSIAGFLIPIALFVIAKKRNVAIQPVGQLLLAALCIWSGFKGAVHFGLLPESKAFRAIALERIDAPNTDNVVTGPSGTMTRTAEPVRASSVPQIRSAGYAWNAQLAQLGANGGAETKRGSIMAKYGLDYKFTRINSNSVLYTEALNFAKTLKGGQKHPTTGSHIIQLMGDGTGPFLTALNTEIDKNLGPEYRYVIVGSAGQSYGEDKWMVPCEWVKDCSVERPELKDLNVLKGEVVITVPKDGDMNIVLKFASDNGIEVNPDPKILDLDRINIEPAADDDYMKAAEQFSSGIYTERKVRKNGKSTGETLRKKVRMVSTWTPGDEYVVSNSPETMVSLADTRLYSGQMPNAIMTCSAWAKQNPTVVQAFLSAIYEAGDLVKRDPKFLSQSAQISAEVYKEKTGKYWEGMYKGQEVNKGGAYVRLGGSRVYNLADAFRLFGLETGRQNLFRATYTVFGNAVAQLYPGDIPKLMSFEEVSDLSYLKAIEGRVSAGVATSENQVVVAGQRSRVGHKSVHINFVFGKAAFTNGAHEQLEELKQQLGICGECQIELNGYTDSIGGREANISLSQARAGAVSSWLEQNAPGNFSKGKVRAQGFGSDNPISSNDTENGRAQNRRVEVLLYSGK